VAVGARPALATTALSSGALKAYPFTLGVASGDPAPDGAVLWSRLAPEPLLADGGMPDLPVTVEWKVARRPSMTSVDREGEFVTAAASAHSLHVEVDGLEPDREYWYRFRAGRHLSDVGRLRTLPATGSAVNGLAMAVVSCQALFAGRYAAYRHIAEQELDLVLHLGDYIYEGPGPATPVAGPDRRHLPFTTVRTLDEYRVRHAQYRLDPDLQAAHAAHPFICVPDDHEVVNNYAGDLGSTGDSTPEVFLPRRAAGYQAYYEHLPLRRTSMPQGASMQLYRRFAYGDLAFVSLLDTRQYRSPQECRGTFSPLCEEARDESRTMTGPQQEQWLTDGLAASTAPWNVIAQQVYLAAIDVRPGEEQWFNTDKWDGYPAARSRLTRFLAEAAPRNPIVLSGDVHATMVNDVTLEHDPASAVVATEFVGTSISSSKDNNEIFEGALPENPQVRYYNGRQRGYLSCRVTPAEWKTDLWFVDDLQDPASAVQKDATYVVEDKTSRAERV